MLLSYDKLKQRPRIFRKLTGMNLEEFTILLERLRTALDKEFSRLGRQRKLATHTDRVLLLLIYYRCYCTHEFLGYFVGLDDSNICRLFQRLEPLIAKKVHIKKDRTLNEEKIAKLLTDVTEQPIQRPKNKKDRKRYYSGKKKRHTQKLEITITPQGKIINLSHSEPGRVHDLRIRQRGNPLPTKAKKYVDLGYQGIQHEMTGVFLPHKKPRAGKLTLEQKEYNRQHSQVRIAVEHKFAQMKQFRILANVYRNFRKKHHLRANIIAGILNFQAGF